MPKILGTLDLLTQMLKEIPHSAAHILPCPDSPCSMGKPDWKYWTAEYNARWVWGDIAECSEIAFLFIHPRELIDRAYLASNPALINKCCLGMEVYLLLKAGYTLGWAGLYQDEPVIKLTPPAEPASSIKDELFWYDVENLNFEGEAHLFWTTERVTWLHKELEPAVRLTDSMLHKIDEKLKTLEGAMRPTF